MAQPFRFGFSNDDIEDDNDHDDLMDIEKPLATNGPAEHVELKLVQPKRHTLQELLSTLPSKISYSTIRITAENGHSISLPRRELFDIRAQIMAEDTGEDSTSIAGLSTDDITPSVYEGGFKTWECSIDLARWLLREHGHEIKERAGSQGVGMHVIELGAGTALPTLTLLHLALTLTLPHSNTTTTTTTPSPCSPLHLTLTDYNHHVLHLATLPNLLLTWASSQPGLLTSPSGELEISGELLDRFLSNLRASNIVVDAVSGAWGGEFTRLASMEQAVPGGDERVLVLASETIYSPSSMRLFTETVLDLLSPRAGTGRSQHLAVFTSGGAVMTVEATARALVAAKRVYFGVGGGVDEFLTVLSRTDGLAKEVWATEGEGAGVGRVVLEVRRK